MAIDIGLIAFQAYSKQVGGKTFDGKDIPRWGEVGKTVQDGWRAAAVAVLQYIDQERERMSKEDPNDPVIE